MAQKIVVWTINCVTENKAKEWLLYKGGQAPNKCPKDTAHTVGTASQVEEIDTLTASEKAVDDALKAQLQVDKQAEKDAKEAAQIERDELKVESDQLKIELKEVKNKLKKIDKNNSEIKTPSKWYRNAGGIK